MPSARHLTLADGQLSSTAATLLAGSNAPANGRVDVVLQNTGSSSETIVLTFQRAGGTARRLVRVVLYENEQAIVYAIPIQPDDTLLAVTSTDSTVDYTVATSGGGSMRVETLDATGTSKANETTRRMRVGIEAMLGDEAPDLG